MVESARLESEYTFTGIAGSNPVPSVPLTYSKLAERRGVTVGEIFVIAFFSCYTVTV